MSFKTASAILRGKWLLDKQWADAHMPMVMAVLKGDGSFEAMAGQKENAGPSEEAKAPKKVLSNKAGTVYSVGYYTDLSRLPNGAIAMMDISGPITKYGDVCAWGAVDHVATINRLSNAPNVKGIILNIDSPGGEVSGTAMLADAIKSVGKNKPVLAMIDDGIAASAAMWIASAANEIYTSQKTDMVGSIGVYTTIADFYGYYEAQGLKVRDIYAPQSTEKNIDYREAISGNDNLVTADLKIIAQEFIDTVAANRAGKIHGTDWQTGKMFYSKEAAKIGLTDGIKSFDQVVRRMDTLIKQKEQSNSNTMAFEKTLAVAKATEFAVVDDGFLLEEAHLNNIEAALIAGETAAADLATATTAKEAAEASLATANETIVSLNAQIATLNKKDATVPSGAVAGADPKGGSEKGGWDKFTTSIDAEAEKLRKMKAL